MLGRCFVGNLSYKEKKDLTLKTTAGHSYNWNTLFLDQNAVADSIAKKYNVTKEKVNISFFFFLNYIRMF